MKIPPLKIGIIGAGQRVLEHYLPIFEHLQHKYEIVGIYSRNPDRVRHLVYKYYNSQQKLAEDSEALLIAVNRAVIEQVTILCCLYRKPLFVETPIKSERVCTAAERCNISIAVAEQFPFLPQEQFKKIFFEVAKELGQPQIVINDFHTYDYHGMAQLRSYIGLEKKVKNIFSKNHSQEKCNLKYYEFESGEIAIHNFSVNRLKYGQSKSLRIYCENGFIASNLNEINIQIKNENIPVSIISDKMKTFQINVNINGQNINWQAKYDKLNDHQEATELLLSNFMNHIYAGDHLFYDVRQGFIDNKLIYD
jgi:predicted dehydrogenase